MGLLEHIKGPHDLRRLAPGELPALASEIRSAMIDTVSRTGGHLASSLGAVELTIAIHYTFNTPEDKVLWDVGHQTYAHKIITGRAGRFTTLRQLGGLSGFPNREESPEYDVFTCGHSSTSISTALGLVASRDISGGSEKVVAVIGDASLAGGMAFEALNHAGHANKDIIVILNDNERSISQSVGALSKYLNRIITNPAYNKVRKDVEKLVKRIPRFGFLAYRAARKLEEGLKNLLIPGMLFEEMGFRYFGPIDGHNIEQLIWSFRNLKDLGEPVLIHVVTKKGKGYRPAEEDPSSFHGTGPFDSRTGEKAPSGGGSRHFTDAFGSRITELAAKDKRIAGVTAAMIDGTGFNAFAEKFPERFFDVGIAEEHAVAFAAGLARRGLRPFVAIYSTFMQRGYDQIIHDVCLQKLPVVFCLDRAGLVGEDGATHHGAFDIAYLRHIPNLTFMAPSTAEELEGMLDLALTLDGPVAIRYPKGAAPAMASGVGDAGRPGFSEKSPGQAAPIPLAPGKARVLKKGRDLAIIGIGYMVRTAMEASSLLAAKRIDAGVVDARFVKPLDGEMVADICRTNRKIVTIEDGVLDGGFGSAVLEELERAKAKGVTVKRLGLPDIFIEHGRREELFAKYNLTPQAVCDVIIREVV
jgi:1-deoxy-D-xylulose-5-phosphate synthase